jgi:hypothetical protein
MICVHVVILCIDDTLLIFIQQEELCDVTTVKEELADEITVDECYVYFDR